MIARRFDYHQHLRLLYDRALPAVNRPDSRQDVHTGGKLLLNESAGEPRSSAFVGAGAQNDERFRHPADFTELEGSERNSLQEPKLHDIYLTADYAD